MSKNNLFKEFLEQSNDFIWMIDSDFNIVYANTAYKNYIKVLTQKEIEINKAVFNINNDENYIQKWSKYYKRALGGEYFEIIEVFYFPETKDNQNLIVSFKPIFGNEKQIIAISCQSKLISQNIGKNTDAGTLLNASLDVFCAVNEQGNFVYINGACLNLWGYRPEELIGKSYRNLILDDDFSRTNEVFDAILSGQEIKSFNNRYKRKDGSIAHNLWSARWDNESKNMYCVARDNQDIVEEKQQLKLLESVITNTHDAVLITEAEPHDLPGPKIVYVNDAFTKMTGYTPQEVIGKTPRILQGPNSNHKELSNLSKAIRNWQPYEITTINYKKTGEEFWINFKVIPVANDKGWFTHWIAIERDVSESKTTEDHLKKAKEIAEENEYKMKEAQKLAHLGSWYYDVVNQVSEWSDETYRIWGLNPETTSVNFVDHQKLIHPKDWERFNDVINDAIEKGIPYKMELELINPDGTQKNVNTIGAPIFDQNNKVIAFKGTTQDITERIDIENELRKAKEKAEKGEYFVTQASNLAKIGYWEVDIIKDTVYWSDQVFKIHEANPDLIIPNVEIAVNFYREDYRDLVQSSFENCALTGKSYDFEAIIITGNNKELWVRTTAKAEIIDGVCKRVYGSLQDIHDIKTAALALEKSLKELQDYKFSLDESAIIAFTDSKGVITSTNDNFCKISGYSADELIGQTHQIINSKHHSKEFFIDLWKTISSGKVFRGEIKNKAKDGAYYWVDTTIVPFLDDNHKPIQYLAIRFDITARKNAEEDNLFKANLLDNIWLAAISIDLNGVVTYWNKAAENIYGWTKEEAIGKSILELTPSAATVEQAKEIIETLKNGKTWKGEFGVKRKDGTEFIAMSSNSPIYNERNELTALLGISSDITIENKNKELLKKYMLDLERSNEELEQFAYVASHDLQEPLRMIASFMDLLDRKYGDRLDEKGHQYVHFATDGAKRMKQIILDLLDYSRAGKSNEIKNEVDINSILSEYKQLRRKLISEKKAEIIYTEFPVLNSFKVPITQIFHCLLDNALNYGKENIPPQIEINLVENETEYQFTIKDNGIGIDPKFHDKIFIIFQRLHNKKEFAGTGIGLSITKRQVEFLGGKIWCVSAEGEGSTFYFTIAKN
jgi:PAS domain S-box-containing protein